MTLDAAPSNEDDGARILGAIEALSEAERQLEALTGGQVDAVVTRDGRTFMLQRSQALLRAHEDLQRVAILNALPASVALVDAKGTIVSVNEAWCRFGRENGMPGTTFGIGDNYIGVCEAATGADRAVAAEAARGLRAVLDGELPTFACEYSCHSPTDERWSSMTVSPLTGSPPSGAVVSHTDVTTRTQARFALQRSSALLGAVISGTPDHVFVKDRKGRYLLCNEALGSFIGRSPEDVIGRSNAELYLAGLDFLTPEAVRHRADVDRRVMETGLPVSSEDDFTGTLGRRIFQATKAPYRDEHGQIAGVIGISRDVTEQKEAEHRLRESQAMLSMASRLALVGSWHVVLPATQVVWSAALATIHEEAEGFSPTVDEAMNYYVAEDRPLIGEAFAACIADGTPFDLECRILTRTGKRVWVRAIGEAVRGDDGSIRRVQGALQDISERKSAEEGSRQLADRLTGILASITDGFLTLDRQWRFSFVNDEALRMLRGERAGIDGRTLWKAFPDLARSRLGQNLIRAMRAAGSTSFEVEHPAGTCLDVHCYPSDTGLSLYIRDITQHRKDQDELRELNARLEDRVVARTAELTAAREEADQANRAKSSFLAMMSHEIRTPMNGVIGMVDVLEQSALDGSQAAILGTVRSSAHALLAIVDDLLDFSKIEAGQFQIDHEPMSIGEVCGQVRDTLSYLADSKGVSLSLELDPGVPPRVRGDAARLRQILLNLVGNAIKFSSGGGRSGTVSVGVRLVDLEATRCRVDLAVTDNGIGIGEAAQARLFTPFTQADASTTRRFGGTGLGLSISSRLAGLMGGDIQVRSAPGQGACFTLRLPLDLVDEAAVQPVHSSRWGDDAAAERALLTSPAPLSLSAADDNGRLILVAEDNETNQIVITRQLALLGFAAHVAADGQAAFERFSTGSYAVLLTDLHMPEVDGYELAIRIRATEPAGRRIPIIALTADASPAEVLHCREIGMDDYMTKPLQLASLRAMLQKWLPADAQPMPLGRPRRPPPLAKTVDLDVLHQIVGSDSDVVESILASFRKSLADEGDLIRQGARAGSLRTVGDAAHKLKSAARSIGALPLGDVCDRMEEAALAGRAAELGSMLDLFEQETASVQRYLDDRPSQRQSVTGS